MMRGGECVWRVRRRVNKEREKGKRGRERGRDTAGVSAAQKIELWNCGTVEGSERTSGN